ncbi:hypothetical protein ACHQM5_021966 [Ranunculus cassubicifolius]
MAIEFPDHLVHLILLYLPVVSLLRFKSVCRSWRSLIESSSFIYQHLDHHQHQQQQLIALYPHEGEITSLSSDPIHVPIDKNFWSLKLIASCNGLVVLHHEDEGYVYLWNPATKQLRSLPQSPAPWPFELLDNDGEFPMGFGFDDTNNDYKIVRFYVAQPSEHEYKFRLEIYNLSTDSWRVVGEEVAAGLPTIQHIFCDPKEPYQKKVYLWAAAVDTPTQESMHFDETIIYFDFSKEVFGTIALPDEPLRHYRSMAIIREKVVWICQPDGDQSSTYDIWLMNEFGNQNSWSKAYKIGPFDIVRWAIGFTGSMQDEKLLLYANGQLCLYDLVTQETQNLTLEGSFDAVAYKESLVPII